ncbi:MAG: tetratricopeptide repeat protein [bacterium]
MLTDLHLAGRGLCGVLRCMVTLLLCVMSFAGAGCRTSTGAASSRTPGAQPALDDASQAKAFAHYAVGMLLDAERGRTTDVQQAFSAAHRFDPNSRRPVEALVMRLLQDGRVREAMDQLESYSRAHPNDVVVRNDLARIAELNDDFVRAARYYDEAYHLQPADLTLAFAHIRSLFSSLRDAEAVAAMRKLIREQPCTDTRNLPVFWAVQFARRQHAAARALPCLDLAVDVTTGATQRVELRFFYGEAALAAGHTNEAIAAFQQTLTQSPMHLRAAMTLARTLVQRDGPAAIAAQTQLTRDTPTHVPALLTLAALHLTAKDRTRAVTVLDRVHDALQAQGLTPSVDIYLQHGATLDELGRTNDAAAVFQEALQHHPRADMIMNYLAYMLAVANVQLDEASTWAQQAVKQRPRSGAYLDTLGWVRYRQQRLEEALDLLLRARERLPDDPTILDHVGDALARLQRTPEAAAYWSRSYALDPAQTAVAEKLRSAGIDPSTIPRIEPPIETPEFDEADPE